MLVKCVCNNCGHSYLADDNAGELECPRCGVGNEGSAGGPAAAPTAPPSRAPSYDDHDAGGYQDDHYEDDYGFDVDERFDPRAPPPMVLTADRLFKGLAVGCFAALVMGAVIGGALVAIRVFVPLVAAGLLALATGAACRYGFGGRASSRTRFRALAVVALALLCGFAGHFAGAWAIERVTGSRAVQTRADITRGIEALQRRASLNRDTGTGMMLDKQLEAANKLAAMSDPQLEDYLWKQQAQINQPLLAYAKLRVTRGPAIQLGANADPIDVPKQAILGILIAEFLAAVWIAQRGIRP